MSRPARRTGRLVAAVGSTRVAVAAAELVEVVRVEAVTWVPCRDRALLGVAVHRDRLVPVVDARQRLGGGEAGPPPWLCVLVRTEVGEVALTVDEVLGFRAGPAGEAGDGTPCVDLATIPIKGAEDGPRAAH